MSITNCAGKLEEASTHKSAKTHAGNVLTQYLDPKVNRFPGLILEHLYVRLGDPSCIGFWDIVQKNRHTDKRRYKPYRGEYVVWVIRIHFI